MASSSGDLETARLEWGLVQAVISRKADAEFKIRGWLYTVLAGLTLAFIADEELRAHGDLFSWLATCISVFFLALEAVQLLDHSRAIERSREIEKFLQGVGEYGGPALSENQMQGTLHGIFQLLFKTKWVWTHFWAPYGMLGFAIAVIAFWLPEAK